MSLKASAVEHAEQSEVQPHQLGQEVFKIHPARRCRLETVPGVPAFRPASRHGGGCVAGRALYSSGEIARGTRPRTNSAT